MKEKLKIYETLLLKWNKIHNLTGATSNNQIEDNIQDSLYPTNFLEPFESCVDIGSGSGFPAIPLAIYYQDSQFTLVEPRIKRASFLNLVVAELGLKNTTVIADKIENLKNQTFDLVTSRAVAQTDLLFELSKNVVTPQTKYLFYKGENVINEVAGLSNYEIIEKNKRKYLYIKGV